MHQLLPRKAKIAVVAALVLLLALVPWLTGIGHLSLIVLVVELVIIWLGITSWRWICATPLRPKWANDLSGDWNGTIRSASRRSNGAAPLTPIAVSARIRQDWLTFSVYLETDETTSRTSGPYVSYLEESEELRVKYFFETDPKAEFRQNNPPQTGCAFLTWHPSSPGTLSIRYTNDRGLGGDISLQRGKKL